MKLIAVIIVICAMSISSSILMSILSSRDKSEKEIKKSTKPSRIDMYTDSDCKEDTAFNHIVINSGIDINDTEIKIKNNDTTMDACCIKVDNFKVTGKYSRSGEYKELETTGGKTKLLLNSGSCPNAWEFDAKPIE